MSVELESLTMADCTHPELELEQNANKSSGHIEDENYNNLKALAKTGTVELCFCSVFVYSYLYKFA